MDTQTDMTDERLIGYCRLHSETERALFHSKHINRMIELAGKPEGYVERVEPDGFYSVKADVMHPLCDLADARMKASQEPAKKTHLRLV